MTLLLYKKPTDIARSLKHYVGIESSQFHLTIPAANLLLFW